jgi:hypothetical protein
MNITVFLSLQCPAFGKKCKSKAGSEFGDAEQRNGDSLTVLDTLIGTYHNYGNYHTISEILDSVVGKDSFTQISLHHPTIERYVSEKLKSHCDM